MKTVGHVKAALILLTVPLIALGAGEPPGDASQTARAPITLKEKVRQATEQFKDINTAIAAGFVPGTPCISGSDGAMRIHFVLPMLLTQSMGSGDPRVDLPQALIYQSLPNGSLRLVGANYIVLASTWESQHPRAKPPVLEGQPLSLVDAPNGYRRDDYRRSLSTFYELPVMAWEQDRAASFADTGVSCP